MVLDYFYSLTRLLLFSPGNVGILFGLGTFVIAALLCIRMIIYTRRNKPCTVNCWFCNEDQVALYENRNAFYCIYCHQYNGFTKDGDYNRRIEQQHDESLNIASKLVSSAHTVDVKPGRLQVGSAVRLCRKCTCNQRLKVTQLRNFEPTNEKNFDREVEEEERRLERVYALCRCCETLVESELNRQAERLNLRNMLYYYAKQQVCNMESLTKYACTRARAVSPNLGFTRRMRRCLRSWHFSVNILCTLFSFMLLAVSFHDIQVDSGSIFVSEFSLVNSVIGTERRVLYLLVTLCVSLQVLTSWALYRRGFPFLPGALISFTWLAHIYLTAVYPEIFATVCDNQCRFTLGLFFGICGFVFSFVFMAKYGRYERRKIAYRAQRRANRRQLRAAKLSVGAQMASPASSNESTSYYFHEASTRSRRGGDPGFTNAFLDSFRIQQQPQHSLPNVNDVEMMDIDEARSPLRSSRPSPLRSPRPSLFASPAPLASLRSAVGELDFSGGRKSQNAFLPEIGRARTVIGSVSPSKRTPHCNRSVFADDDASVITNITSASRLRDLSGNAAFSDDENDFDESTRRRSVKKRDTSSNISPNVAAFFGLFVGIVLTATGAVVCFVYF